MEHTKARILHVDDHQDTRLMMAALLQDRGYGVMTAGSVAEALELAKDITCVTSPPTRQNTPTDPFAEGASYPPAKCQPAP